MNVQSFSPVKFIDESDLVCDEILQLLDVLSATGANRARHIAVVTLALMDSLTPAEREASMEYIFKRLSEKSN
jgi:hypothetical protein